MPTAIRVVLAIRGVVRFAVRAPRRALVPLGLALALAKRRLMQSRLFGQLMDEVLTKSGALLFQVRRIQSLGCRHRELKSDPLE